MSRASTSGQPGLRLADFWALTKPSIVRMNVLMTLGGWVLADASFRDLTLLWTLLGTALAVASANAMNMYLERDIDGLMTRTANRPLPAGRMHPPVAAVFGAVLGLGSLALLGLAVNVLTAGLALAALVLYVAVYTPMKRKGPIALLIGAVPGAAPPLMGWTAATGQIELPGLVLFAILVAWQIPHFIAIALFRADDYERAGVKTVSLVRGDRVAKAQAVAWTTALIAFSLALVPLGLAGWGYGAAAALLGLWFLVWGLRGFREGADEVWAQGFFRASLVYLPVLTLMLALDVGLR